jgi:hypothetical protein
MPKLRPQKRLFVLLGIGVSLVLAGFVAAVLLRDTSHKLDAQLSQLREAVAEEQGISDSAARKQYLKAAAENPGSAVEVVSYLFLLLKWPDSDDADLAREKLRQAAKHVDIVDWERSLAQLRGFDRGEQWMSLAALLIERVRQQPDHPRAARLLCEIAVLIYPDHDAGAAPPELVQIAEMIRDRYASSPDIANFLEVVGNLGYPAEWSTEFESHVRHIIDVNQDRFVQCSAHFALASIVRSGGPQREGEAFQLYEQFIERFDGETVYRGQPVEKKNRQHALQVLKTLQHLGMGNPSTHDLDTETEGPPMTLAGFRYRRHAL